MNTDTEKTYTEVCFFVEKKRIKEALLQLEKMLQTVHSADFANQLENLDLTYKAMLDYTFRSVPDPKREQVYHSLQVSILELADQIQQKVLEQSGKHTYTLKASFEKQKEFAAEEASRKFDTHSSDNKLARLLNDTDLSDAVLMPHVTPEIFQLIWLSDKYIDNDIVLIESICKSDDLPWHEKSLAVSALTISLLRCFDKEKFRLLRDFYNERQHQVWQRALVGLVLALHYYNRRILLYPSLLEVVESLKANPCFFTDIRFVLLQILKALETEKVARKFQQEIMPDMRKFEEQMREKLDLDNILEHNFGEDKNPDWEKIFEDSPELLNKIEEMSQLQMEGIDLFMGTFAQLKHFPFFNEISNWFKPFYKENESVQKLLTDTKNTDMLFFLDSLEKSFYMCNSDRYSFCFNVIHLPDNQKQSVIGFFNMEAESLRDVEDQDRLLSNPAIEQRVFTQYIQDLYRFYKIYPFRNDFRDVFSLPWEISQSILFHILQSEPDILRDAANFLFEKERYPEAINLFTHLLEQHEPNQIVIEKLAYAHQVVNDFENALVFYKKAELFDSNRLWCLKKIIFCLRQLKRAEEALQWCNEVLSVEADDVYGHTMAGNCYLDLKQYQEALNHYFRVEFLAPNNKKVLSPIAWCSFALNKLDIAKNYMQNILTLAPTGHDYINAGHVEFCLGNKFEALELYRKSLLNDEISIPKFREILFMDQDFLIQNGVDKNDLPLVIDFLKY